MNNLTSQDLALLLDLARIGLVGTPFPTQDQQHVVEKLQRAARSAMKPAVWVVGSGVYYLGAGLAGSQPEMGRQFENIPAWVQLRDAKRYKTREGAHRRAMLFINQQNYSSKSVQLFVWDRNTNAITADGPVIPPNPDPY